MVDSSEETIRHVETLRVRQAAIDAQEAAKKAAKAAEKLQKQQERQVKKAAQEARAQADMAAAGTLDPVLARQVLHDK